VQAAECSQADTNNRTPAERTPTSGGGEEEEEEEEEEGDDPCEAGQELWGVDCGIDGDYDYAECFYWWEDPYEWGDEMCNPMN
jgi:hypothetical protein